MPAYNHTFKREQILTNFILLLNLFAQTAVGSQTEIRVDDSAKKILQDYAQSVADHAAQACLLSLDVYAKQGSETMNEHASFAFASQMPNKLKLELLEGRGVTLVSNGQESVSYIPRLGQYRQGPAPASLQQLLLGDQFISTFSGGATAFIWMLTDIQSSSTFLADITWMVDMGLEEIDGQSFHRVYFQKRDVDMNAWFEPNTLQLRRLMPDLSKMVQAQPGTEIRMTFEFQDWKSSVADSDFEYTPPKDAKKVAQFSINQGGAAPPASHGLIGKSAPAFSLKNLEGKSVSLADHKNKDVVVIDFWATWCGPCRMTMPLIAELAQTYKDKNVHVYALNLRENKAKVESFLKQKGLDLNVILDETGSVGKDYVADAIPQTVVIGQDGRVQSVHIGVDPNLKAKLEADIDTLLTGKNLVD